MGYFTDTTNAPKVYTEYVPDRPQAVSFSTDTGLVGKTRSVTNTQYEFRGLTRAAANSIALAKADTVTTTKSARSSPAGHYTVTINVQSETAWA